MSLATGLMGFDGQRFPTGYGSVSLKANINGYDVGDAWSKQYSHCNGTEHAEDALIDYIESLEYAADYPINQCPNPADVPIVQSIQNNHQHNRPNTLVITDLTASPCSSRRHTTNKPDMEGCAERLIRLASGNRDVYQLPATSSTGRVITQSQYVEKRHAWQITIHADHLYQPRGTQGAKALSEQAVGDMRNAGIRFHLNS